MYCHQKQESKDNNRKKRSVLLLSSVYIIYKTSLISYFKCKYLPKKKKCFKYGHQLKKKKKVHIIHEIVNIVSKVYKNEYETIFSKHKK